jgi:hypothetical protein
LQQSPIAVFSLFKDMAVTSVTVMSASGLRSGGGPAIHAFPLSHTVGLPKKRANLIKTDARAEPKKPEGLLRRHVDGRDAPGHDVAQIALRFAPVTRK